jgi:predicted nucleic acid-binding protein
LRYLLDSTLLIDHANGDEPASALLRRLFAEGHDLYTCDVVSCETLSRGEADELRRMQTLLHALEYVATSPQAAQWAGESRRARHATGGRRSLGDALIAGVAQSLDAIVVTRNAADFARQGIGTLGY